MVQKPYPLGQHIPLWLKQGINPPPPPPPGSQAHPTLANLDDYEKHTGGQFHLDHLHPPLPPIDESLSEVGKGAS